jgi:hypothetical protein
MLSEEDKQVVYRAETRRHNKKGKSSHRRVLQRQRASLVTHTTPRLATKPNLSGYQPFPLNPSFKPQPQFRTHSEIHYTSPSSFMANPEANSVRSLASRYHLSIKRVDAILRLKGLEES